MLIKRTIEKHIRAAAREFQVIALTGPRQSGKTTLTQMMFAQHRYCSLEDYDIRTLAHADPRKFLNEYPTKKGLIIDEIQHAPQLLSYMQTIVDREKKMGFFIVTGSQNFLVDQAITQTLAGRMAVFTLFPLSIYELQQAQLLPTRIETLVYKGCYPRAHAERVSIEYLYQNYLRLYVERDARTIKNVANLSTFQKFIRLCVGRIGQIVNLTSLGDDCGINRSTAQAWLSLLEASYIIFLLYPYYKNFGKRVIKAPKLYFVDTGIACSLLKIRSAEKVSEHYLRGGLVESLVMSDLLKQQYNSGLQPSLYFWRDKTGNEIDCIIDESTPIAVEIKAGTTIAADFFKSLNYWQGLFKTPHQTPYLVYAGSENQRWPQAHVLGWHSVGTLIKKVT